MANWYVPREAHSISDWTYFAQWKIMPRELGSFEITNELDDRGLTFRASPQAGQAGYPFIQDAKATAPTYWTFSEGSIGYQKFSRSVIIF